MSEVLLELADKRDKRLPENNPAQGRFVLHYNPLRAATGLPAASLEKHFGAFVTMLIVFSLLIAFAALVCLVQGIWYWTLILVPLSLLPFVFMDICRPTNIELSVEGIRFHWMFPVFFHTGPWVSWPSILLVNYLDGKVQGITKAGKCFELTLDVSTLPTFQRILMETLCTTITTSCDAGKFTVRLLESGFFQEGDQATIRSLLCQYVASDRLDSRLTARAEFGEIPAYTALWLDRFNAGTGTERSTVPDGTVLAAGKYKVLSRLGCGGQAVVYDAVSLRDAGGERCVLKEFVLPVRGGSEIKGRAVDNIQREASMLKSLDHRNIVKYKDLFVEGQRAYLVMERVDGVPLDKIVERDGPMSTERVMPLAMEICDLMEYLHSQTPPVIHRDLTPENLMLYDGTHIKLIDFNVAQRLESTSTKTVVGKHAYIPPEQFRGRPTAQSDIYAFGATLYFLVTGEEPEPISKADPSGKSVSVDARFAAIIARATEPDTAARYPTVAQIKADLLQLHARFNSLSNRQQVDLERLRPEA